MNHLLMRLAVPLYVLVLTCLPGSAQERTVSAAKGKDKDIRVVLVTGGGHDFKKFTVTIEKLFEQVGGIKIVQRLEPGKDGPDAHILKLSELRNEDADVVIFYTVGYKLDPIREKALEQFVDNGGGLVAIHCASASFGSSATWLRLVGARFAGHYKGLHKLEIKITDPAHPIMKGVEPFTIVDEEYNHSFAKVEMHVLAEFKERPEGSKGKNNDIVWTRNVGKGRVFYSALGHGPEAWGTPAWQKMVLQGICWSAGQPRVVMLASDKK